MTTCAFSPTAHLAPTTPRKRRLGRGRLVCLSVCLSAVSKGKEQGASCPSPAGLKDCTQEMVLLAEGFTRWLDSGN